MDGEKVYVDVGAYDGRTVVDAREFAFDTIHAFEPSKCWQEKLRELERIDQRIEVWPLALWDREVVGPLYHAGNLGATLLHNKPAWTGEGRGPVGIVEPVRSVKASEWLGSNTSPEDRVWMKLNCEGVECDILMDLLGCPDLVGRMVSVAVDFDIAKVIGEVDAKRKIDVVCGRAEEAGLHLHFPWRPSEDTAELERWFSTTEAP